MCTFHCSNLRPSQVMLQQLRRQHVGAAVKFKRCQYLYRYYTRNHLESQSSFWGGLKGVLSKQDNGHFGVPRTNSTETIPSWRSPERNLAIVMIISDLPRRLSKHLEDFLRFLGEAHGGEVLHRMSTWNLLSHQAVALAEEKNVVPKSGSRHVCWRQDVAIAGEECEIWLFHLLFGKRVTYIFQKPQSDG